MNSALESLKSAVPSLGAGLVGWPWWAVAVLLLASFGPHWAMGWLDVVDRVRRRSIPRGELERLDEPAADASGAHDPEGS